MNPTPRNRIDRPGLTPGIALAAIAVTAPALGGCVTPLTQGVILCLIGLLWLAKPPAHSLAPLLNVLVLGVLVAALCAFLPAHWFSIPSWRTTLVDDFGITLANTRSPQPWLSINNLILLVAGIGWTYSIAAYPWTNESRRILLRAFCTGVTILALVSLFAKWSGTHLWHKDVPFGPFPNRNQTATLFALASLVAFGCAPSEFRRKPWLGIVWILAGSILVWAIVAVGSRAGLLILIGGALLWTLARLLLHGSREALGAGLTVTLLIAACAFVFGKPIIDRLVDVDAGSVSPRIAIWQDAWTVSLASPWTGIGLGNFEGVFALFRDASLSRHMRVIHPESDWLWSAAELGWPATLALAAAGVLLLKHGFPFRGSGSAWRLAAAVAAVAFALNGLVDVPAHRIGTSLAGLMLLGLSVAPASIDAPRAWVPVLFRFAGASLVTIGAAWIAAISFNWELPGAAGVENSLRQFRQNDSPDCKSALALVDRALGWAPLDWELYYARAVVKAVCVPKWRDAYEDFRRARLLEPGTAELPEAEALVWRRVYPPLAVEAWRESLRRRPDRYRAHYYDLILGYGANDPALRRRLLPLAGDDIDLQLSYYAGAPRDEVEGFISKLLLRDPALNGLAASQMRKFFQIWNERGNRPALIEALESHKGWQKAGAPILSDYYAKSGNFERAYLTLRPFMKTPKWPESGGDSLAEMERRYYMTPENFGNTYSLIHSRMDRGEMAIALVALRKVTSLPNCPGYFHFLEAECAAAQQNWPQAWEALNRYRSIQ